MYVAPSHKVTYTLSSLHDSGKQTVPTQGHLRMNPNK